jgi:hypothetical protein
MTTFIFNLLYQFWLIYRRCIELGFQRNLKDFFNNFTQTLKDFSDSSLDFFSLFLFSCCRLDIDALTICYHSYINYMPISDLFHIIYLRQKKIIYASFHCWTQVFCLEPLYNDSLLLLFGFTCFSFWMIDDYCCYCSSTCVYSTCVFSLFFFNVIVTFFKGKTVPICF